MPESESDSPEIDKSTNDTVDVDANDAVDSESKDTASKDTASKADDVKVTKEKAVHPNAKAKEKAAAKEKTKAKNKKPVRIGSPRWVVPLMLALFGIGLLWIIVYYIVPDAPFMASLSYWNVAIGFVLISLGFVVSTKWK